MVTVFMLVAAAVAVEGADREAVNQPTEPRGFHEFHAEISSLLKQEAAAKSPAEQAAAVRSMCRLHSEIVRDERYAASDKLKEYRAKLWSRLKKVQSEMKQRLARSADPADKQAADQAAALAAADATTLAAADSLAASLAILDDAQGSPAMLLAFGGRAVPPDHGRDLVELIERTINPAFWDVNGGPGTVYYYAPLQCLVVRATTEVHGTVGAGLGALRAAGK